MKLKYTLAQVKKLHKSQRAMEKLIQRTDKQLNRELERVDNRHAHINNALCYATGKREKELKAERRALERYADKVANATIYG